MVALVTTKCHSVNQNTGAKPVHANTTPVCVALRNHTTKKLMNSNQIKAQGQGSSAVDVACFISEKLEDFIGKGFAW
jgi:hypothetical protein